MAKAVSSSIKTSSTVESRPFTTTPRILITTRPTSVTRLRTSFGTASRQETHTIDAAISRQSTHSAIPNDLSSPLSTDRITGSKESSSENVLEEKLADSLPGPVPARTMSQGLFRLISPVWNKTGGRSGPSSSGGLPRRSKKGQAKASNTYTRGRTATERNKSDNSTDDISPTSSAGPSSPRARSPVHQRHEHTLDGSAEPYGPFFHGQDMSPMRSKLLTGIKAGTTTTPRPEIKAEELGEILYPRVPVSVNPESIRKQRHTNSQISEETPRQSPTTPGESITLPPSTGTLSPPSSQILIVTKEPGSRRGGTGDGSLICSPLPSPFRRNRIDHKSPVDEPISIYQGLIKPTSNPTCLSTSHQTQVKDEPKTDILLKGDSKSSGKRKSTSWVPSKLRRLSIKRGKNRKASDEVGTEKVSSSSKARTKTNSSLSARRPEGEPQPEH